MTQVQQVFHKTFEILVLVYSLRESNTLAGQGTQLKRKYIFIIPQSRSKETEK